MNNYIIFLILKKLRIPIILLIVIYSVSIIGLTLIPGVDNEGNKYYISFFHAFYIVSYTATTIGFGEIPFEWNDNQRLWMLITIYISVIAWFYAIGNIISLATNTAIKEKIFQSNFEKKINRYNEEYYILCGYGVTGKKIVELLQHHLINVVVIEKNKEVLDTFYFDYYTHQVPYLLGDISNVEILKKAGIKKKNCKGVILTSGDENSNLKAAITTKILNPNCIIISKGINSNIRKELSSFNVDYILSPYNIFSKELLLAMQNYSEYKLKLKLVNEIKEYGFKKKPPNGKWIICGYKEFGRKAHKTLIDMNLETTILTEENFDTNLEGNFIKGNGTDKQELLKAGITEAQGIILTHNEDQLNLSAILTIKNLNKKIFIISKQNENDNKDLFSSLNIDMVIQTQIMLAKKIYTILTEPCLEIFFNKLNENKDIIDKLNFKIKNKDIETWHINIEEEHLKDGIITIEDITTKLGLKETIPLLVVRAEEEFITPENNFILESFDTILFCGTYKEYEKQSWFLINNNFKQIRD